MKDTFIELLARRFGGLPASDAELRAGDDRLGARGGEGVVCKTAREPASRVALAREVEVTLRLAHPALRRVRASAQHAELALAVFERVDGLALDAHLAQQPTDAERVTGALLDALRALHDAGLAHGDLKPEHVLVEADGRVRLIDLGLVTPLGATVIGGTHGYLAPELLAGAPVSVASELFALAVTMRAAAGPSARAWSPRLTALLASASDPEPRQRPASAAAARAALGVSSEPTGVRFGFDRLALAACGSLASGALVVVEGARGSGRSALVRALVEDRLSRGLPTLDLCASAGFDPLLALADVLEVPASDEPTRRVWLAVARAAALSLPIVLDDAELLDEDGRASLDAAARALAAAGSGALVSVGSNVTLPQELAPARVTLAPLDFEATRQLLEVAGARADVGSVRVVLEEAGRRAGTVARVARRLALSPELAPSDAVASSRERRDAPSVETPPSVEKARRELARGAPRRAAALLRALGSRAADDQRLLARAEAAAGRLDVACALLVPLLEHASPDTKLEHARLLERLGRHAEARECALALSAPRELASSPLDARGAALAAVIAATSTLALGDPEDADRIARAALACPCEPASRARLSALRSDAALRRNDSSGALAHALEAETAARESGEPASLAHAIARSAAAYALSGDPRRARERWREALTEAERAADVGALPPYLMNLATAEHALGELGDAMRLYERAAALAGRLGRQASRAAALTNLAGLFALAEADDDALRVLAEARTAAQDARAPLYVAQTMLIEAEVLARRAPERALERAAEARAAFEACGAGRQALEAELLQAELAQARGAAQAAVDALSARGGALAEAGLGARMSLLVARVSLASGALDVARRGAEEAASGAKEVDDRDLEARALLLAAEIHDRLDTGLGDSLRSRAREAFGELAARMPTGLRERYLGSPARVALRESARQSAPALAAAGLNGDARRLLALVGRVLLEPDEQRVLELALDEAVVIARAERAFLLLARGDKAPEVAVARNLDRESVRQSRFRFSRSVAERVLATGEPLVTADAADDPALAGARSILALGLRSILCVPVRAPAGVIGALYLDHRFEKGRFGDHDRELVQALGDVIGLALENGRLHREAAQRTAELTRAHASLERESEQKDRELERLARALEKGEAWLPDAEGILGRSPALRAALDVARRVAPSDLPVLIEGESGTGKELFARFVHAKSRRASGPFVALNCGALPEALIESELFGHVRGAFTGAVRDHQGTFRAASGGTLLLDEIGELPLRMQTRLLRVLQEREVVPVGAGAPVPVDVRVLAATNRDLEREVEAGRFRRDLYFRLHGVRLRLPALRDRREDVPAIAEAALERIAGEPGMRRATLTRAALSALIAHDWPGNVRELEQALRRAVAIADEPELGPEHFELVATGTAPRADAHRTLDRGLVEKALRAASGNRTVAARALGISRVTLHRTIAKLAIDVPGRLGRPRRRA